MILMQAILAINESNVLGVDNKLAWNIPEDLEFFKSKTVGNIIIMGRKTYESLPSKGLPYRINIVLTRNPGKYKNIDERLYFVNIESLDTILEKIQGDKKIFIIGGAEIYSHFFKQLTKIYLTLVFNRVPGDVYSPITMKTLQEQNFRLLDKDTPVKSIVDNQIYQHLLFVKDNVS